MNFVLEGGGIKGIGLVGALSALEDHGYRARQVAGSFPIFFAPVRHANPITGQEHVLLDGGLRSNFPVWLFEDDPDGRPTISLRLDELAFLSKRSRGSVSGVEAESPASARPLSGRPLSRRGVHAVVNRAG